jgi:hypothetical protein
MSEYIIELPDSGAADEFVAKMGDYPKIWDSVAQARRRYAERIAELNITYNKAKKCHVSAA